jgi:DNA-binding phage protein
MCEVHRTGFPKILLDNDEVFLNKIVGVLESVDELASMEISKTSHCYSFRIAPSMPKYIEPTLHELLNFMNMFGIKLDMAKSMKVSSTITFNIEI